jgi:hypothetical protein
MTSLHADVQRAIDNNCPASSVNFLSKNGVNENNLKISLINKQNCEIRNYHILLFVRSKIDHFLGMTKIED